MCLLHFWRGLIESFVLSNSNLMVVTPLQYNLITCPQTLSADQSQATTTTYFLMLMYISRTIIPPAGQYVQQLCLGYRPGTFLQI